MSNHEGITFLSSGVVGGVLSFFEAGWVAIIAVPILTGFLGMLGKEFAKTLIELLKHKITKKKKEE